MAKKVGICIDAWKLVIFTKHLTAAGYAYAQHPGVTPDTLTLMVETDLIAPLQRVIEAAQKECKLQ